MVALERLRQDLQEFEGSLGYTSRPCLERKRDKEKERKRTKENYGIKHSVTLLKISLFTRPFLRRLVRTKMERLWMPTKGFEIAFCSVSDLYII